MSTSTKDTYFEQGHSPASARDIYLLTLEIDNKHLPPNKLELLKSNRSTNPWSRDIYHLFRKWRYHNFSKCNGDDMFTYQTGRNHKNL